MDKKYTISLLLEIEVGSELTPAELRRIAKVIAEELRFGEWDWLMDAIAERITPELYSVRVKEL